MKKEIILNSTEKKRNQFSAEYFSKGASSTLKEAFKNNMNSKFNSLVDKFKKEKEEKEKKIKEKEDKIKKLKEQKKQLKFGVKTKALAFIAIAASAVIFFKKIERLFTPFKYRMLDEVIKKQKIREQEEILKYFNFSDAQLNGINDTVDQFNTKLETDITENFSNPLQRGIEFFLHLKGQIIENNPYFSDEKLTKNWTESQKKNGIIGDFLDTIAQYALIYLIDKRGYGFILKFLNLEVSEWEGMDETMWKVFSEDRKLYPHIGRDISGTSRLGDKLMSDVQKKNSILKEDISKRNVVENIQVSRSALESALKGAFGSVYGDPHELPKIYGNLNEITKNIKDQTVIKSITKGVYKPDATILELTDGQASFEIARHQHVSDRQGGYKLLYTVYYRYRGDLKDYTIEGEKSDELFKGTTKISSLPKLKSSNIKGFDMIINKGGDYITQMYPLIKFDNRINHIIDTGLSKIVENYENCFIIKFYEGETRWFAKHDKKNNRKFYNENEDETIDFKRNLFKNTWKLGGALILMQLVKIVAEWELYQSFVAAKTIDSLYNDFINDGKIDKIQTVMKKIHKVRKQKAEKWQIDYARGRRTLTETIEDYGKALEKLLFKNPKYKKSEFTSFVKSLDMKSYIKSKVKIKTFDIKNSKLKPQFQGLKNEIILNLHSEMKKIKYGKLKADVMNIGERLIGLGTKRRGLNSKNVLVINNNTLRENFNLERFKNYDAWKSNETNDVPGLQKDLKKIKSEQFSDFPDELKKIPNTKRWDAINKVDGVYLLRYHTRDDFLSQYQQWEHVWFYTWNESKLRKEKYLKATVKDEIINDKERKTYWFPLGYNFPDAIEKQSSPVVSEKIQSIGYNSRGKVETTTTTLCLFQYEDKPPKRYWVDTYVAETIHYDEKTNKYSFSFDTIKKMYIINPHENKWVPFYTWVEYSEPSQKSHAAIYEGKYDEKSIKEVYNMSSEAINDILLHDNNIIEEDMLKLLNERLEILNELLDTNTNKNWDSTNGRLIIDVLY